MATSDDESGGDTVLVGGQQGIAGATAATAGGGTLFAAGLGSLATPLFFKNVPTPKTVTVGPYGNYFDISQREMNHLWREMVQAPSDFAKLEMSVANGKTILEFFIDKAVTFRCMRYMNIPTSGTGLVAAVSGATPGGQPRYSADLGDSKNLLEEYKHITIEQVMAFTSWFMGDEAQALAVRAPDDMKMRYLDVTAAGNSSLVARFKQELRTVSCLIWHTIKNHFSASAYKALLVRKKDFAYECTESSEVTYDGFTLLRMIFDIVKPSVIVDVNDLQRKMEKITLLSAGNNFQTLCTTLEGIQQEINAEKGDDYCKDDAMLMQLFRAAETTTNEGFAFDVRQAKVAWMTGKIKDKTSIINDLCAIYRNMVADESWNKVSSADSKIIALTTQVKDLKKQLEAKPAAVTPPKPNKKKAGAASNKEVGKNWRYTKVGDTLKCPETGKMLKWCPHHGDGCYMPSDHNHQDWLEKRKKKRADYEDRRSGVKRVHFDTGDTKPAAVVKEEKHPSKLQLSSAIRQSLVTACSMTPSEADKIFNQAFDDAKRMDLKE